MVGLIFRRVLRRLIRGLVRLRWPLLAVLALLLIGGAVGVFQAGLNLPTPAFSLPGGTRRAPQATEDYMKAQQTFNADLEWSSYSDDALDRLRARNITPQDRQQQMDQAKSRGVKIDQVNYVGSQPLPDGTSFQFYVVASSGLSSRTDPEYVTYIFTLDRSGKISKVQ